MRILVTGANGQVGLALQQHAENLPGNEWYFLNREELDITREDMVQQKMKFFQPDMVINTAAFTAVDQAETDIDMAFILNRDAVGFLAKNAEALGARFMHISTDYVYDNSQCHPYLETDPAKPRSVYARSKRAGEEEAFLFNPRTTIIRTSWLYGTERHNFLQTMVRLSMSEPEIKVVFDQVGSPTYTHDLALAIIEMLKMIQAHPEKGEDFNGIFNYSNEGVCSWYDFAVAILKARRYEGKVIPIRTADYPRPAKRPSFSVMDKMKIKQTFGLQIPHWEEALRRCMRKL